MMTRFFISALSLFFVLPLFGQTPMSIKSTGSSTSQNLIACPPGQQNFAGTVSLGAFVGQSNDIDLDTMYFCLGDQVDIIHNGDANLSGDPDMSTAPGIGYAFYDCLPTISGPDKVTIGTDACLVTNPPPADLFYVATAGNLNGDILFANDGNLVTVFNGGNPGLFWWAPITFDSLVTTVIGPNTIYQALFENNGPCVHANIDAAFATVYLNAIQESNVISGNAAGGCGGSFDIAGGLPEFDGSNYTITIQNDNDPTIFGTVTNGSATHGDNVEFSVPESGTYTITVEDGKSCGASFQTVVASCNALTVIIPTMAALPGTNFCLEITAENFTSIVSLQFTIQFDDTILDLTSIQGFNPGMPSFNNGNFNVIGNNIIMSYFDPNLSGITLPDGSVLFELCFDVIGGLGECAGVIFTDGPPPAEVTDNTGIIGFNGIDGKVVASSNILVVMVQTEPETCSGDMDGAFDVTVSNGTPPYNINWEPVGGGPIQGPGQILVDGGTFSASNQDPGMYTLTVTDNSLPDPNVFTTVIEILDGPELNVIFDLVQPLCNGGLGDVSAILIIDSVATPNPGPNYSYQWASGPMTQTLPGVPSGLYTVTITDNILGCEGVGTTFLPQPSPINISVTDVMDATCSGVADGSISFSVSGGTPDGGGNYQFTWTNYPPGGTSSGVAGILSPIPDGTYVLLVTDGNGCQDSLPIDVGAAKSLIINTDFFQDVTCNSLCDGQVDVSASTVGGVSNIYNFNWSGAPVPPASVDGPFTSSLSMLCAGTYTVELSDDDGCMTDTTFVISEPDAIAIDLLSFMGESCAVGDDGTATIGVSGGIYPYGYDWGLPGQTDSIVINLSAGMYEVTVTDANMCMDSLEVTITQPVPPSIISLNDDVLNCSDSMDGELTVIAQAGVGGAAITDYSWSTGNNGAALITQSGLGVGTYYVTVTDGAACFVIDSAIVTAPAPLLIDSIQTSTPLCPGLGGGAISVFVSGGTGPYFFDWSLDPFDGIGNSAIAGGTVVAGDYTVEVTDANNCPSLLELITLEDPPSIVVSFSAIDSVSCFDSQGVPCDGLATASAEYSDGAAGNFNFNWSSGETDLGVPSSMASMLCQGNQNVVVSDGTCAVTATVLIPAPTPLMEGPNSSVDRVSCFGFADGTITADVSGGTPPYSFDWGGGITGQTINNLAPDDYVSVISDSKGCQFQFTATVGEPDPFVAILDNQSTLDTVNCFGDMNGVITVSAQGGNLDISTFLSYSWQNNISSSSSASGLGAGIYSVTVSDVKGCEDEINVQIFEPSEVMFEVGDVEPILCAGQQTFVTVDTAYGGTGFSNIWYSFSVDNAVNQSLGTPIPIFAGAHLVTVSDDNGCTSDTLINILEPAPILLEYPDLVVVELGDSVVLQPSLLQLVVPLNEDSVYWTPQLFLTFGDNPLEPTVTPIDDITYEVLIYDENGCPALATVRVEVDKNINVYIPNIFSPDGNGLNDFFQVFTGNGVEVVRNLRIFDRWGEMVFYKTNIPAGADETQGWDGTFRGREMNSGVYVYMAEVEYKDGRVILFRGDITLMR
ncbi:MAG: gliding motility-associated C-terminal domain-containing protein [Saprospiraceae bacterium]|nr:gliding motility-associated C-terminal domain-containing protein [Saprospiraceae bacterium]